MQGTRSVSEMSSIQRTGELLAGSPLRPKRRSIWQFRRRSKRFLPGRLFLPSDVREFYSASENWLRKR